MTVTKENFEALAMGEKTLVLDFWAPWCGPCRMIAPILEQIAEERQDILLGKVNVDEEMELAVKFGIVSIPTVLVICRGEVTAKSVGYLPKEELLALLG